MEKIRSRDGTPIVVRRTGSGPPLVLVHGMLGSTSRWPSLALLEPHFTVYTIDRRGRRESGDTQPYAIEREYEDIAAVVESVGDKVNLFGHSFGGLCVLEAALQTPKVRRLIVYEPPPAPVPDGAVGRLQALLDAGDREGLVTTFLREVAEMPAHELEFMKNSPVFPEMLEAAHTVPRELEADSVYSIKSQRFAHLNVPVLLLRGSESPAHTISNTDAWHAALPNSRIGVLEGQQHIAHYTAPELFVGKVRAFLEESIK